MDIAAHINENQIALSENIGQSVKKERGRLLNYIKKQVDNVDDAEDILQDVFFEFAESTFLLKPIEQVSAWLYAVARNRITDLFRKKKNVAESDLPKENDDAEFSTFFASLLDNDEDPEFEMSRSIILEEMELALNELPKLQRMAFEKHELEGISFKQLAADSGETVNTWITRKRYAILHLRKRLQSIYYEFIND